MSELEKWIAERQFGFTRTYMGMSSTNQAIFVDDLRALFDGKVLVPVEPTPRMLDALYNFIPEKYATKQGETMAYKSMLAASQEQIECSGCGWKGTRSEYQDMTKKGGRLACCPERKLNPAALQEKK
jgi:hypothetical protein